jgi:hypothetical protein
MGKISEEEFNSKKHVKEYKRKCNECGKVWHSLEGREKEVQKNIKNNAFSQCAFCGNPGAQLQAKRNVEAGQSELERLKKCPNCGSMNYNEEVIIYEKK